MDRIGAIVLAAGLLWGNPLAAAPASVQEPVLKAAFIGHFLVLTRWPEPKNALVIGVYGQTRQGDELAEALARNAGPLPLRVLRIQPDHPDWAAINALYIPGDCQTELPGILLRLGSAPILTIGDSAQFMERGGVIGFIQEDHRLRFAINQRAALEKGLQLSAKLLELARSVQR